MQMTDKDRVSVEATIGHFEWEMRQARLRGSDALELVYRRLAVDLSGLLDDELVGAGGLADALDITGLRP